METRRSVIKYIIFLTKSCTTVWLELWSKWCIYIWKGICVHLMNYRIISIYGKKKRCKIFRILITAVASKWERPWYSCDVPFLTTAAKQSLHRLLAALQEKVLILEILAGKGLVWCIQIITSEHMQDCCFVHLSFKVLKCGSSTHLFIWSSFS